MYTKSYYVYITTNPKKTVLYTGVTNNLPRRLHEHYETRGEKDKFASRYYCYNLVYYDEPYASIHDAIAREKEIKKWRRAQKEELINGFNPEWNFLNAQFELGEEDMEGIVARQQIPCGDDTAGENVGEDDMAADGG